MPAAVVCCGKTRRDFKTVGEWRKWRYANDPVYRQGRINRVVSSERRLAANDPNRYLERLAYKAAHLRRRYAEDPEYRAYTKAKSARHDRSRRLAGDVVYIASRCELQRRGRRQKKIEASAKQLDELATQLQEQTPDE